jgi:hypothetical protein
MLVNPLTLVGAPQGGSAACFHSAFSACQTFSGVAGMSSLAAAACGSALATAQAAG